MKAIRICLAVLLLCAGLCAGCVQEKPSVGESMSSAVSEVSEAVSESVSEESLPTPEAIILLYDRYLVATAKQDGISYTYTYCLDEDGVVFNAIAEITFPEQEDAVRAYRRFLKNGYLNLTREDATLSFAFPRKSCPYYGIAGKTLSVLLQDTVYTVTEEHFLTESEEVSADLTR